MENLHGVDVSWLHRSTNSASATRPRAQPESKPKSIPSRTSTPSASENTEPTPHQTPESKSTVRPKSPDVHPPQPPALSANSKSSLRRPGLLSRLSSDKSASLPAAEESRVTPKKSSWRSLGSKFSSQGPTKSSTPPAPSPNDAQTSQPPASSQARAIPIAKEEAQEEAMEDGEVGSLSSQSPKPSGFLSSALRRLSSSTSAQTPGPVVGQAAPCERKTLNVDQGRERSTVKELDQSKLRRVSFSVDVEIAGNSRYPNEDQPSDDDHIVKKGTKKDKKIKERAEGEALKNPLLMKQAERGGGMLNALGRDGMFDIGHSDDNDDAPDPDSASPSTSPTLQATKPATSASKVEKPISPPARSPPTSAPVDVPDGSLHQPANNITNPLNSATDAPAAKAPTKPNDRPTTDPLRIYRRCCQLREAPVLKRISEQLGNPNNCSTENPGIISCLNLNRSRMQLADVVCLGDWLAVVPVKKLLLEDANLTDEGVRVILAGLLAAKPPELHRRKRGRSSPTRLRDNTIHRSPGIIEKVSLKNNPKLTSIGWKHISLFLHLSKSITAMDVSMIPFPPTKTPIDDEFSPENANDDPAHLLYEALGQRRGDHLEELIFGECGLTAHQVSKITQAATKIKLKRLGLAGNRLDEDGLKHVSAYIKAQVCKGLDIGGNNLRETLPVILDALDAENPIWALCLADCNLSTASMKPLFSAVTKLPDFRFVDFSHNRELFTKQPTALSYLRKYLPQLPLLKRIHLMDVAMSPADAIALAEILPEVRNLAHINLLENPQISAAVAGADNPSQEEAVALYASIMTAVRLSKTLICVDIDTPGPSSSEIVKALARQAYAYCLRNMERFADKDVIRLSDAAAALPDISDADTSILDNITGPTANESRGDSLADPKQNDALITGGTGWMKALNYILDAGNFRRFSTAGDMSPNPASATEDKTNAREVSKTLINVARNIKKRVDETIPIEEKGAANDEVLRRLQFLQHALQTMIHRFEVEYPDCRRQDITSTGNPIDPNYALHQSPPEAEPIDTSISPSGSRGSSPSRPSEASDRSSTQDHTSSVLDDFFDNEAPLNTSSNRNPLGSRRGSETELHNRALTDEEGQIHKMGQRFRREVLPPAGQHDMLHGTSERDIEPEHLAKLRSQLEEYGGEEMKRKLTEHGFEGVLDELDFNSSSKVT